MNQNYNLMRLANLYGGMNKYALDEQNKAAVAAAAQQKAQEAAVAAAQQKAQEAAVAAATQLKALEAATPSLYLDKAMNWAKANPLLAGGIGAGALGLGGLGAYYALKDDEEEQKKSASTELPLTALTNPNNPSYPTVGAQSQYPGAETLDPVAGAEATKKNPLPGYTFGTEELAMNRFKEELAKDPSLLEKIKEWIVANPGKSTAIGAGALGLGGLGAYYALKDDEEEQKKSASYIDPYVAQVLAHDYLTKMAAANGVPSVAAGVTGLGNYARMF